MSKLTADAVRKIAGQLDENQVIEILNTGASEEELVEAFELLYADDDLSKSRHHAPDSRIALLRDILTRQETAIDEER